MTKTREVGTFESAILDILRILGAGEAAEIVNLSSKTVRDYSDPDRAGRPRLAEALKLDVACMGKAGRAPLFEAYVLGLADTVSGNFYHNAGPTGAADIERQVNAILRMARKVRAENS